MNNNNNARYWCHKCKKRITPNLEDFSCPTCKDPFIEEIEDESELMRLYGNVQQNQTQQQPPLQQSPLPRQPQPQPFPFLFGMPPTNSTTQQQQMDPFQQLMQQLMAPGFMGNPVQQNNNQQQQPRIMRRMNFLDMMDEVFNMAGGGGGLQFGLGGGNGGAQMGDYFVGNIDQLLSRLAEQFNGPIGTPPASKSSVEKLEKYEITAQDVEKHLECAVCQDKYQEKEKVIKMPCTHMFHEACLMPWLELHNSCPTCRHELPTDDKEYEERKKQGSGGTQSQQRPAGGQSSSNSQSTPQSQQQQQQQSSRQNQQPQFFNPFFQFFGGPPGNNNNNRRPPGSGGSGGGSPSYII